MRLGLRLARNISGAAAAELALALPLLLILICGSVELGNYFLDEHRLVKAVRDGARFAARQNLSYFTSCSGAPGGTVVSDTQNVIRTGVLSNGDDRMPGLGAAGATIDVTIVGCRTTADGTAGGSPLSGFYANVKNSSGTIVGAPIVEVNASIPYTPVVKSFGFSGYNLTLNAKQQAAVIGW